MTESNYNVGDFVNICVLCGYASEKTARQYAKEKELLNDDDFISVFRINERKNDLKHPEAFMKCDLSGSELIDNLNKRPDGWKKDNDLNRGIRRIEKQKTEGENNAE